MAVPALRATDGKGRTTRTEGQTMRVVLDRAKCAGVGLCEAEAPDLFEVQNDGTLVQLEELPRPGQREAAHAAVVGCPNQALTIVED